MTSALRATLCAILIRVFLTPFDPFPLLSRFETNTDGKVAAHHICVTGYRIAQVWQGYRLVHNASLHIEDIRNIEEAGEGNIFGNEVVSYVQVSLVVGAHVGRVVHQSRIVELAD